MPSRSPVRLARHLLVRHFLALSLLLLLFLAQEASAVETLKTSVGGSEIAVHLYVPNGQGPFPVLILSHGSPRSPSARAKFGEATLAAVAKTFVARGVLVAVPIRRGYGGEGSGWAEGYGRCENADYYGGGLATAQDIRAAASAVRARPDADPRRLVYMGVSAGGWGSIAAATHGDSGLLGVVNFAGGRGSRGPNDVCSEEALISAAGRYGGYARAPELWLYSGNDLFFGPDLAKRLHAAFTAAGGKARFVPAPAYGRDGHGYINAVGSWRSEVEGFLRGVGFMR